MAWVVPEQYVSSGEVVDPRDVMRNVNAYAREWNGMWDADNMDDDTITAAKLAVQALMAVGSNPLTTTTTVAAYSTSRWVTLSAATTTGTSYDGVLCATGCVHWSWSIGAGVVQENDLILWRLVINGRAVAHSGWYHVAREKTSCRLSGSVPTGRGSFTIDLQYTAYPALRRLISDNNNGENTTNVYAANPAYTSYQIDIDKHNILWEMRKV